MVVRGVRYKETVVRVEHKQTGTWEDTLVYTPEVRLDSGDWVSYVPESNPEEKPKYKEYVKDVREVCNRFRELAITWKESSVFKDSASKVYALHDALYKSNLAARLIYGFELKRTRPCPVHKTWTGLFNFCPCHGTGWIHESYSIVWGVEYSHWNQNVKIHIDGTTYTIENAYDKGWVKNDIHTFMTQLSKQLVKNGTDPEIQKNQAVDQIKKFMKTMEKNP